MKDLRDKAMLVALSISKFGNRKRADDANETIAREYQSDRDMSNTAKRLLAKSAVARINSIGDQAREYHYRVTLPWLDTGWRILPAANYFEYSRRMGELRDEFDAAIDAFIAGYDASVEEARGRLGKMFHATDYPSAAALRRRYAMEMRFRPMEDSADFRVDLGTEEIAKVRAQIESTTKAAWDSAVRDLWTRVYETVSDLRDRLAAYEVDEQGKVHHPFRDTAITHLRDLVELLPRLNVMADATLASMTDALRASLCRKEPDDLRANPAERDAAIAEANAMLAAMAGYVGVDLAVPALGDAA